MTTISITFSSIGASGSGKSMLAARLPSILPPLTPSELLEVSMIRFGRGQSCRRTTDRPSTFPRASPFRLNGGPRRRWSTRKTPARRRWRITAFCSSTNFPSSKVRRWTHCGNHWKAANRHFPRHQALRISCAIPVDRSHEPLPLRSRKRTGSPLPEGIASTLFPVVPGPAVWTIPGSHRSAFGSACDQRFRYSILPPRRRGQTRLPLALLRRGNSNDFATGSLATRTCLATPWQLRRSWNETSSL